MTEEQEKKALDFVKNKLSDTSCPICNNENWAVKGELTVVLGFDTEENRVRQGYGFPQILVTCDHCFYSMFFDADSAGVI